MKPMRRIDRTHLTRPAGHSVDELRREARESVALVLMTLVVVVTISFVGLALT